MEKENLESKVNKKVLLVGLGEGSKVPAVDAGKVLNNYLASQGYNSILLGKMDDAEKHFYSKEDLPYLCVVDSNAFQSGIYEGLESLKTKEESYPETSFIFTSSKKKDLEFSRGNNFLAYSKDENLVDLVENFLDFNPGL